ncbi:MAG: V-type ATP synthase subunit F [Spirochaetales bacterium]|nr:V-type ATP synthase subunit F [Spirochaetales bacterium]
MNYFIIGDEDAVLGFELVGIPGIAVSSASEAEEAFGQALSNRDTGIIIITEEAADGIRALVDRYMFTETFPLIVEIPGSMSEERSGKDLRTMVNEAIGIKL